MSGDRVSGENGGRASAASRRKRAAPTACAIAILLAVGAAWWFWPVGVPRRYLLAVVAIGGLSAAALALGRGGIERLWKQSLGRLPFWLRTTVICLVVILVSLRLARWPDVRGVPFLLYTGVASVAAAAWCGATVAALRRLDRRRAGLLTGSAAVAVGMIVIAAIITETVLALRARSVETSPGSHALIDRFDQVRGGDPIEVAVFTRAVARHDHTVMPDAWRTQAIERPGARLAQRWHGVDHAEGPDGVRLPNDHAPSDAPSDTAATILVIGDSFTYGLGIEPRDRFTEQLDSLLKHAAVDARVINRGVCSDQSEDVLRRLPANLESFAPDLVIYAICLNDFLPTGVDVYDRSWTLPAGLDERSRLLRLTSQALVQLQIALGLSADFHSDILRNFGSCRDRFERDVKDMHALVRSRGIPMLAIVLDPMPSTEGTGSRLSEAAERACRSAGIDVVETASLRERFAGVPLIVSRWEPHANEIAHAAWARLLFDRIRSMDDLQQSSGDAPSRPVPPS